MNRPTEPESLARDLSLETYSAESPKTLATSMPDTPASVSETTDMLRRPISEEGKQNIILGPKRIMESPLTSWRWSVHGSGIPGSCIVSVCSTTSFYQRFLLDIDLYMNIMLQRINLVKSLRGAYFGRSEACSVNLGRLRHRCPSSGEGRCGS